MAYLNKFTEIDDLIRHLTLYVTTLTDEALKAKYAGFLSVSAVTVYELAIKEILVDFARKKHIILGSFVENHHLARINGKIRLPDLRDKLIKPFGDKYVAKFDQKLSSREIVITKLIHKNISSCYSNLVMCRHNYFHKLSLFVREQNYAWQGWELSCVLWEVLSYFSYMLDCHL